MRWRRLWGTAGTAPADVTDSMLFDGYAPAQMIEDLRKYQAELEIQNKALRYSQQEAEGASERFATLFSNVPLALMVVDEQGLILASNAMALRLFQPTEQDPPLTYILPLIGLEHADEVAVAFLAARNEGTSEVHEVEFRSGAQGHFTGDLHIARIENPSDELANFICAVIDQAPLLAERRALQESAAVLRQRNEDLLMSENRMAAIINSSLDAILCIDDKQCITIFNPAATTLFECPADHAFGAPLRIFLPEVAEQLETGSLPPQAMLGEFTAKTLTGKEIFVEISVSMERRRRPRMPLHSQEQGTNVLRSQLQQNSPVTTIFARDLTARKLAERQRATLENQLRESQKMQAMGTMAGGIAHDFNNILSAILGNVELAMQDTAADAASLVSLQEIEKAGRKARDLVRQILTFSRNEPPRRAPTQVTEIVEDTARLVRVTLPPGVDFQLQLPTESPWALADATQLEQALLNLCTNAILAIEGKGKVRVVLDTTHLLQSDLDRLGLPPKVGPYVRISVHDTGTGMDEATMRRIFEPFFTTREVGKGTGLGLSVVHGIMQTHHGCVDVNSTMGQGSCFSLYLPAISPPASVCKALLAPTDIRGQGKRVMYVDDDQALVFLLVRVLTRKGFVVTTFTDPHEALAALAANPQGVDLLVTDYNMPGFSGLDVLRQAKQLRPDMPVALASGYVTPDIERRAREQGADALIYKPNDVNELCETVQQLMIQHATP
ncbi:response regulator [Curvibacter sp. CHRR-16]|nr:response regulator [Curvibacter sp. CHRR-16]